MLVVYVDSGSTDGSVQLAKCMGVDVVELDSTSPFTAARARNAGFVRMLQINPIIEFVQFIDGDCELVDGWIQRGLRELMQCSEPAVVFGCVRERFPEASVYNRLCDLEWNQPIGEVRSCGGIAMMRATAFRRAGGFNPSLIAGEEPELCLRLRMQGGKVLCIDQDMATHDADMTHFHQWWTRTKRAGHAFAERAWLHRRSLQKHDIRQVLSILFWAGALPAVVVLLTWPTAGASLLLLVAYPVQWGRIYLQERRRARNPVASRLYATFVLLGKFAQLLGLLRWLWSSVRGQRTGLIEHKRMSHVDRAPVSTSSNP